MILVRMIGEGQGIRKQIVDPCTANFDGLPEVLLSKLKSFSVEPDRIFFLENIGSQIVVERIDDGRSLFVFGAGHVGRSVALMGVMLGLRVVLIDDRQDFLERDELRGCGIEPLLVDFEALGDSVELTKQSACVIVTRGHQFDELILRQIANQSAGYVGMIGSKRRVVGIFERLRKQAVDEQFLNRIRAPIGLSIGATSPQEIAVAIHAEIIKYFSSGSEKNI